MVRKLLFSAVLISSPFLAKAQSGDGSALSQDAQKFVAQFWSEWSSPNAVALPYIESTVGNEINFYGKPITRDAYMKTETDFAQRWPDRQYMVQPGSEHIGCEQGGSACNVKGIVVWKDFSPDRKVLSAGSAKFSFALQEQTVDGQHLFLIAGTSGAAIERAVTRGVQDWPPAHMLAPAGYVGPGDLVPGAVAFYGLRAYDAASAASGVREAIEIRRASDDATRNIGILQSGRLDTATASAFCAATTCYVVKWYDQTGHGNDITQDSPGQQPVLALGASGTTPSVQFNAAQMTYLSGSFPWVSGNGAWSGQAVLLNVTMTRWFEPLFEYGITSDDNALYAEVHTDNAGQFTTSVFGNEVLSGVASQAPAALTFYSTGAQLGGYVNGFNWSQPFDESNIMGSQFNIGGSPAQAGIWLTGGLGEVILYAKSLSAGEAAKLATNERQYYGFVNAGPAGPDQTVERSNDALEKTCLAYPSPGVTAPRHQRS